jgi:hypothetical protein
MGRSPSVDYQIRTSKFGATSHRVYYTYQMFCSSLTRSLLQLTQISFAGKRVWLVGRLTPRCRIPWSAKNMRGRWRTLWSYHYAYVAFRDMVNHHGSMYRRGFQIPTYFCTKPPSTWLFEFCSRYQHTTWWVWKRVDVWLTTLARRKLAYILSKARPLIV